MKRLIAVDYAVLALALAMGCFATAMGQSSFSLQTKDGMPVQQIALTVPHGELLGQVEYKVVSTSSTNYTVNLDLSLNTAFPYFALTPVGGTTPLNFSLYQQSIAQDGTYTGSLQVTSVTPGTVPLAVPVSIAVGGPGGSQGTLTATPASLAFTTAFGTNPASQFLTISAPNNAVTTFNASVTTTSGGSWLTVFPPGTVSTGPSVTDNLAVSVNVSGLSVGPYTGVITVTPTAGGLPTTIPVSLNVTNLPSVGFSPVQMNFAYQTGTGTAGLAQSLTLTTTSPASLFVTLGTQYLTGTTGWLVLSELGATISNTSPATITVSVVPTSLQPGTYSAQILVSAPSTAAPVQTIPVTLIVSTRPVLQIGTPPQPFNYQIGGAPPPTQTLSIGSSSTNFAYSTAVSYDAASGAAKWLAITPGSGNTPATLNLSINPTGLGAGKYTATVTVIAPGAVNSPQQFQAVLNVGTLTLLNAQPASLTFNYQVGKLPPGAEQIQIISTGQALSFVVSTSAASCGGGWLSVQPLNGVTPATLAVAAIPGGIAPTVCNGSIAVTASGAAGPLIIPVAFNVSNTPLLNVSENTLVFNVLAGSGVSAPQYIGLTSTDPINQVSYTAAVAPFPGGGNWLLVANGSGGTGSTPANLAVAVIPGGLPLGTYSGAITITSPNLPAPQTVSVTMNILQNVYLVAGTLAVNLTQEVNSSVPVSQTVQISSSNPTNPLTFNALTSVTIGNNWLSVSPVTATTPASIAVTANANGQLPAGIYSGTVTIQASGAINSPLAIPVTLTVAKLNPLTLTPASVSFTGTVGGLNPAAQTVQITSSAAAGVANLTISTTNTTCGGNWFSVAPVSAVTPAVITITPNMTGVSAGTCNGTINVSAPGFIPTMLPVSLIATNAPVITKVQNAASYVGGSVSPGEIVYLEGLNLGPATLVGLAIDPATGLVETSLGGTQVLFDGQPAPLVYASSNKVSAIVPYEVSGRAQTAIQVSYNGAVSTPADNVTVATTAPGIFSADASGTGQAAALNQDGSYNSATAPAPVGSVVSIYATGEGLVSPLPPTGSVTGSTPPLPTVVAPVTVKVGGVPLDPSSISYAGPAPSLVAGVIQINFTVPNWASGATALQIVIGDNTSNSVTFAAGPAQ